MNSDDTLFGVVRNGVLTLSGNNASLRTDSGYLVAADGPRVVPSDHKGAAPALKDRMVVRRFARAEAGPGCSLERIIAVVPDGYVSFSALRWLHDTGVVYLQLGWRGEIIAAAAPIGPDRAAMRRQQALAAESAVGLAITREILRRKLQGQAAVARLLGGHEASDLIEGLVGEISSAHDGVRMLASEATAAVSYWSLWSDIPVRFARRDRVADHWCAFGQRQSALSGKPRRATTPGGALLNYIFAVLAGEMTVALTAVGLDPGIGIFHADRDGRASLAYDAVEIARPLAEAWILHLLAATVFAKRDFVELPDGEIRITKPLSSHLAMTAPLWRHACGVIADWLLRCFLEAAQARGTIGMNMNEDLIEAASVGAPIETKRPGRALQYIEHRDPGSEPAPDPIRGPGRAIALPPLPDPLPGLPMPGRPYRPALAHDIVPRICVECGRALAPPRKKFCSDECAVSFHADSSFGPIVAAVVARWADPERSRAARLSQSGKASRNVASRLAWRGRPGWSEEGDEALRRWYVATVQPALRSCMLREIMHATGLSKHWAVAIHTGRRVPHPCHFAALAKLVGVEPPEELLIS